MTDEIRNWMRAHSQEHIDQKTGELCCTMLVEACSHALGHDEWLDDLFHDVWDIALEFDPRVM